MGRAVHRGRDVRALHRLLGLRHRVPLRRPGLRRHRGQLQALPRGRRRRARQLHPWRRRAAPCAPGPAHASAPGSPTSRRTSSAARTDDEVAGIARRTVLARAAEPSVEGRRPGRRLVSALLIWAFEHDVIDAALVSGLEGDGSTWKAVPGWPGTRRTSSPPPARATPTRPTRSPTPTPSPAGPSASRWSGWAARRRRRRSWQARKAGKIARRFTLSIGLLCSKTFDDAIFPELFEAKYGLTRAEIVKMNIKGVFQVWMQRRQLPRDPAQGGPRLDPRGLHGCPTSPPSTPTSRPVASAPSATGR